MDRRVRSRVLDNLIPILVQCVHVREIWNDLEVNIAEGVCCL